MFEHLDFMDLVTSTVDSDPFDYADSFTVIVPLGPDKFFTAREGSNGNRVDLFEVVSDQLTWLGSTDVPDFITMNRTFHDDWGNTPNYRSNNAFISRVADLGNVAVVLVNQDLDDLKLWVFTDNGSGPSVTVHVLLNSQQFASQTGEFLHYGGADAGTPHFDDMCFIHNGLLRVTFVTWVSSSERKQYIRDYDLSSGSPVQVSEATFDVEAASPDARFLMFPVRGAPVGKLWFGGHVIEKVGEQWFHGEVLYEYDSLTHAITEMAEYHNDRYMTSEFLDWWMWSVRSNVNGSLSATQKSGDPDMLFASLSNSLVRTNGTIQIPTVNQTHASHVAGRWSSTDAFHMVLHELRPGNIDIWAMSEFGFDGTNLEFRQWKSPEYDDFNFVPMHPGRMSLSYIGDEYLVALSHGWEDAGDFDTMWGLTLYRVNLPDEGPVGPGTLASKIECYLVLEDFASNYKLPPPAMLPAPPKPPSEPEPDPEPQPSSLPWAWYRGDSIGLNEGELFTTWQDKVNGPAGPLVRLTNPFEEDPIFYTENLINGRSGFISLEQRSTTLRIEGDFNDEYGDNGLTFGIVYIKPWLITDFWSGGLGTHVFGTYTDGVTTFSDGPPNSTTYMEINGVEQFGSFPFSQDNPHFVQIIFNPGPDPDQRHAMWVDGQKVMEKTSADGILDGPFNKHNFIDIVKRLAADGGVAEVLIWNFGITDTQAEENWNYVQEYYHLND